MLKLIKSNIVNISFLVVLLFPPTTVGFVVQFVVLVILLFIKKGEKKELFSAVIIISIIASFLLNINVESSLKNNFRAFNLALLFLFFPITKYEKIKNSTLFIASIFIIISQILIAYRIPLGITFFDVLYPAGDLFNSEYAKELTSVKDLASNRYAGLYRNPNICAEYLCLLFIVFIIENFNKKASWVLSISSLFLVVIVLTGSRTGIITYFATILAYLFFKKDYRYILMFSIGIPFFLLNFGEMISNIRIFNIGNQDSINIKYNILIDYIENPRLDLIHFLLGNFTLDNTVQYKIHMFDSGVSNHFFSFGFLGVFILILFYGYLFSLKNTNIYFLMIINLFAISSGVIIIYRMSFLFILLLSNYYSLYTQNTRNDSLSISYFSK
jgi:hypothetical protein